MIQNYIPINWINPITKRVPYETFNKLDRRLTEEYSKYTVYPALPNVFNAINGLAPEDIKVVILGQDPYHEHGQAHGLSFSVPDGQPLPPSLRNVYKELHDDLGVEIPESGNLERWKKQGVLLLNTVLTVREHQANSHKDIGWEEVTAAILDAVIDTQQDVVFILWGRQASDRLAAALNARGKCPNNVHIIRSAHPSPLSAYNGFFGSKPFSTANKILTACNKTPIRW